MTAVYIPHFPDNEINRAEETSPIEPIYTYDVNLDSVLGTQRITEKDKLKTTATLPTIEEVKKRIGSSNEEVSINCEGAQTVSVQLSGTWAGTISFECRADDGNYVAIVGFNATGLTAASSTTAGGVFLFNVSGLKRFRLRFSTYTSGTAIVNMISSAALTRMNVNGSQGQLLSQKATTFELNTYDTNLVTVFGALALCRAGFTTTDFPQAPTVNPTQPTSYTANNFAQYPQKLPRLRVEIGGDKKLPLAQEDNTNRLVISYPELISILEKIYLQVAMQTQILASTNNFTLPGNWEEIR